MRGILRRDGGEIELDALVLGEQVEAALHAGQHAEREDVDLHEFQRVDVVLVPFDHLAVLHRGRLDRDELVEPVVGEDEAAGMLREMARRADQLARQIQARRSRRSPGLRLRSSACFRLDALLPTSPRPGRTAS